LFSVLARLSLYSGRHLSHYLANSAFSDPEDIAMRKPFLLSAVMTLYMHFLRRYSWLLNRRNPPCKPNPTNTRVANPSAYILDTGERLDTKVITGAQLAGAKITADDPIKPETQVVVIRFSPVKHGQSIRLRISETYIAASSYRLDGDDLVFDRSLGRPRNAVVLPAGWYLTGSSMPAKITQLPDSRIRLEFWNDRPDAIDVLIKGKRRVERPPS
jgi:hypothetical protein